MPIRDEISKGRMGINHIENLELYRAAPNQIKLLHVLEILAALCLKCLYYMNHLKDLELHLVHLNL